ncbi:MAG TPA: class I SAM-dependent methyltransferase [Ferruginibacter sp.]|nr:class I SAM-dependent methyltransferase [Ferruginibacter sp.]
MQKSDEKIYLNDGNRDVLNLVPTEPCTVLDVGCGGGTLASILSKQGYVVDGITISPAEQQAASAFTRNVFIHNLEDGLPEAVKLNEYDCVICSHVLEHIVYPRQLISDIHKVLKPGGVFIVALPNLMHYKSRIKLLKGDFEYADAGIWDYTHVKWYTFKSAQNLLKSFGFQIDQAMVTGQLPFYSVTRKLLPAGWNKHLFDLLRKISSGLFGYQIIIRARK